MNQSDASSQKRTSVFFIYLMILGVLVSIGFVTKAQAEGTDTPAADNNDPQEILLTPLQQLMSAEGSLKQWEYERARQQIFNDDNDNSDCQKYPHSPGCRQNDNYDCQNNPQSPQCQNACQQVQKVEDAWFAVVVKSCKCYEDQPDPSYGCEITCAKMGKEAPPMVENKICSSANKPFYIYQNPVTLNGLVFFTYVTWDMGKVMEETSTLTQNMNMMFTQVAPMMEEIPPLITEISTLTQNMNMMFSQFAPLLQETLKEWFVAKQTVFMLAQEAYYCAVGKQKSEWCDGLIQPEQAKQLGIDVKVVYNLVEKLVGEQDENKEEITFLTYLLWQTVKGLPLAVDGLDHLHQIFGALDLMMKTIVGMNNNMIGMNRHMYNMDINMGVMARDMDSTMGRAGRAMPWMPWGW